MERKFCEEVEWKHEFKENNAAFFTVTGEFVHVYLMDKGGLHPGEVFRFH